MIEGVVLTSLKIIEGATGNVQHVLKQQESSYRGFGEAYISTVHLNSWKGWKKHTRMWLNVVVPVGRIKFILFDDREDSPTFRELQHVELSISNYMRLSVPPGVWMAFSGMEEGLNMLINIASISHDPSEAKSLPLKNDLIPDNAGHL